jgi:hydroxymethylpyrimidine/phosphomethylpyrimidine kinase
LFAVVDHNGPTADFAIGTGDMLAAAHTLHRTQGEPPAAAVRQAIGVTAEAAEMMAPFSSWRDA